MKYVLILVLIFIAAPALAQSGRISPIISRACNAGAEAFGSTSVRFSEIKEKLRVAVNTGKFSQKDADNAIDYLMKDDEDRFLTRQREASKKEERTGDPIDEMNSKTWDGILHAARIIAQAIGVQQPGRAEAYYVSQIYDKCMESAR